ncbi:hypothetical protein GQ53DRAFT_825581 [Thozetella sp. PMI_491]|nr:hypothetical protein GQ53DRAFT_825581 [Thozetella sp. PMI_491]
MGSTGSNGTWTPPPDDALNFTKSDTLCDAATRWYGDSVKAWSDTDPLADVSPLVTYTYIVALLPDNYSVPDLVNTFQWLNDTSAELAEKIDNFPVEQCSEKICEHLDWKGDPDISGVGMMVSYYIAAVFATVYFVVLAVAELRAMHKRRKNRPLDTSKFLDGFTESVNTFLDAALVFALSMLIAAMTRYVAELRSNNPYDDNNNNKSEPYSIYGMMGSVYMSTFSIFPALVLHSVGSDLRRHWLRLFFWLAIMAFVIALDILYRKAYKDKHWAGVDTDDFRMEGELVWLHYCDSASLRRLLESAVTAGHAFLGLNSVWWLYYFASSLVPERWKSQAVKGSRVARSWRSAYPFLRLINGLAALAFMWLFLVLFTHYRGSVAETNSNGYEDGKWTFGQTLALATWAPVLVDLTTVYLFGAEGGLSSKLSRRYRVVPVPNEEQHPHDKTLALKQTYSPLSSAQEFGGGRS